MKITAFLGRQSVYANILVGFSFLLLTLLTAKIFAPQIETDATTQTASQTVGPYTMSMSNDNAATINITPTASQAIYTTTNNVSVTNTCTSGATITMKGGNTYNALRRTGTDSLTKDIAATSTTGTTDLSNNSWGYKLTNNNNYYYAMPTSSGSAVTIYNASAAQISALSIPVTFGVKADSSLPSGAYTNTVVYTMTPKSGCFSYGVTWNFNSGTAKTGATYPSSLNWGATVNLSTLTPTRSGYTFNGWSNGSSTFTGSETAANVNSGNATTVTLTAQWKVDEPIYEITLNNQSATSVGTTAIYERYGVGWFSNNSATTSISTITKPAKTGYTFKGYYTSTNCSGTQRINESGTITAENTAYTVSGTIYACWKEALNNVYFVSDNGQGYAYVHRVPTSGGSATSVNSTAVIANGGYYYMPVRGLAISDGYVYFVVIGTSGYTYVYKAPTSGGSATALNTNNISGYRVGGLAVSDGYVYFLNATSNGYANLYKVSTSGGSASSVNTNTITANVGNWWNSDLGGVAVSDGYVYFLSTSSNGYSYVYKVSASGGSATALNTNNISGFRASEIAISGDYVYFATESSGTGYTYVYKVSTSGGSATVLNTSGGISSLGGNHLSNGILGLAVSDDYVYFLLIGSNGYAYVYKISTSGGSATALNTSSVSGNRAGGLAVSDGYAYFVVHSNSTGYTYVYKVSTSGGKAMALNTKNISSYRVGELRLGS